MGQFNLISFSLREISTSYIGIHKLLAFNELLEKYQYFSWEKVDVVLHEKIFQHLLNKMYESELLSPNSDEIEEVRSSFLAKRSECVFENWEELHDLTNSSLHIGLGDALIAWHFATHICYYEDLDKDEDCINNNENCKINRCLADYMLYLLVFCPSLMPKESGEAMYRATCASAMGLFMKEKRNMNSSSKNLIVDACKLLRKKFGSSSEGGDDAIIELAINFVEKLDDVEEKWKAISKYWLQTLIYVAANSEWKEHGQQLKNGGELLTHVKLLMAHLGFE